MEIALRTLLKECSYKEDVVVLKHFVFHQRLNGCSNACILCHNGCDGALLELGHMPGCDYPRALARVDDGRETLKEYINPYGGSWTMRIPATQKSSRTN
jgi:hypothetical protein